MITYRIQSSLDHPILAAIGLLTVLFITRHVVNRVISERKIQALGGHTGQRKAFLGLKLVFEAIWHGKRDLDEVFWTKNFSFGRNWTVEYKVLGVRIISTANEDNIKAILASQFNDYGKGKRFNADFHEFLGDSIFTTDGKQWQESRQLIRPQFIKDRVSDLHVFERHVQNLLPLLAGNHHGQTINVADLFYRFTLDASTDFLLGDSVGSLKNPAVRFANAFADVQRVQSIMARAGPIKRFFRTKAFTDGIKVMNEFIQPIIERTLRFSPEELDKMSKHDEGYNFLYALASFTRDRTVLRDQLVGVLLAGRDSTACTLAWMFYHLSQSPEIVAKLREEILEHVGSTRLPTYEDIKSMKYLNYCINETLRLDPIVPYNVRVANKDTTLPRGGGPDGMSPIGVPAGTPIGYSTLMLQRREDIYPPVSEKFPHHLIYSPDRWEHWTPKVWTYIPFNGGPRICVGQQFAITEVAYTTVRILQTYQSVQWRGSKPPAEKSEIVLQPAGGVEVAFFPAEKSSES